MQALFWLTQNWKLVLLMIVVGLLGAMAIRISYLDDMLESSEKRVNDLEGYKDAREDFDEIDADLDGDASASREFLRRRKRSSP